LLLTLSLLVCGSAVASWAQVNTAGTVVGQITDPQDAVVPGVQIKLTDRSTGSVLTTTTNDAGRFAIVNVSPGTYDLTASKTGFTNAKVSAQTVEIGKTATINVKLQVGATTETVEVQASNVELQTMNATVGNTINGVALQALPSMAHDVSSFVELQPGVSPGGDVAGTLFDQSTFQLDGGQNTNDMDGSMSTYTATFAGDPTGGMGAANQPTGTIPTPSDSVEEFKVNTTNQTADFNSSGGAQVQVATKRGTNQWHASGYEYYEDNNFAANTWNNNCTTFCGSTYQKQPDWHRSWFGVAGGGPIIKKEILGGKTYLFANYQGFRWPGNSETTEVLTPSAGMRLGLLTDSKGNVYNLNPTAVTYPSGAPAIGGLVPGTTYAGNLGATQTTNCPGGTACFDPRGIGINSQVSQIWNKSMPLPNDFSAGDKFNDLGYKANLLLPYSDNFGVARIDHDFGSKWHFNGTYHYYRLQKAFDNQVDVGGALAGDTFGVPAAAGFRPQVPWYYTGGMTTNVTATSTNDFHYSYLRNWWLWGDKGDPAQLSGLGAAIEPFGESQTGALIPYNVNTQSTRTRFWDGKDQMVRDDYTLLKGNHLIQIGGSYQHNFNWHQRTDNGGGINDYPVYELATATGSGLSSASGGYKPSTTSIGTSQFGREYSAILGIVSTTQQAFMRQGPNLALQPALTPAQDQSTIPYYNVYFSDSWHMKPSLTLTYGLGYALEMPVTEANGKQIVMVDQANNPIKATQYMAARQQAALQGLVYNPVIGYATVNNVAGDPKYPYEPFYGGISPRVAAAWNPDFGESFLSQKLFGGGKNTVFRAGYSRQYGRINGVAQVLLPLLGYGLIQASQCFPVAPGRLGAVANVAGCATSRNDATTAWRLGTDGLVVPTGSPAATLPQPAYPGTCNSGGLCLGPSAQGFLPDPSFRPSSIDSFDFTMQRQIGSKNILEIGYIGRLIHHELTPTLLNAVPYMMTLGGQRFDKAYAGVQKYINCTVSIGACGANIPATGTAAYTTFINSVPAQPFFETALGGTGYCTGYASCTAAVLDKEGNGGSGNLLIQDVWHMWSDLDTNFPGTGKPGFNFPFTMQNTAGFTTSGTSLNSSAGYGNYHAGFVSWRIANWHGITSQSNLTWGKALGAGGGFFTQSTSSATADDPYNLANGYGYQAFDRKFVYNTFIAYQPPIFQGQQGFIGRALGGWTFAPIFAAGSGNPIACATPSGNDSFGEAENVRFASDEQCAITAAYHGGSSAHFGSSVAGGNDSFGNSVGTAGYPGGLNMFGNPVAVSSLFRAPILGLDTMNSGAGVLKGLPYWNMDMQVKKNIKMTERFNGEFSVVFTNLFNHVVLNNPTMDLSDLTSFGTIKGQANNPRNMEFGFRLSF
jgi:hypothetical protein